LNPIIFPANTYKTILIKANVNSTANGAGSVYVYIQDATGKFKTEGVDSGTAYDFSDDQSGNLNLKFTSPYAGGTYVFDTDILEIKKSPDSPSGNVARGSAETYAIWDVVNKSSALTPITIDQIKFTTKTGFAGSGLAAGDFKLYDSKGNPICVNGVESCSVTVGTSDVTFAKTDMLTVNPGEPDQLRLVIDTTSTTKWPSKAQMQWTIAAYGDLTSSEGYVGYGGEVWSIPADTNVVTLP
jgi:hypothetical protein